MVVAAVVASFVLLAVAALLVLREVRRLRIEPRPRVFDMDEAFAWVVEKVPDEVAATLTPDDVFRILGFLVELLGIGGVPADGASPHGGGAVVFGSEETVGYVLARAAETGDGYLPEQVQPVIDVQLAYLEAIGAVGPPVDGSDGRRRGSAGSEGPQPGGN